MKLRKFIPAIICIALIVLILYLGTGIMVGAVGGTNAIRNYLKV